MLCSDQLAVLAAAAISQVPATAAASTNEWKGNTAWFEGEGLTDRPTKNSLEGM
jgi:hypothetical protein